MSISDKLRELNELREAGILTDAEFEAQKAQVLSQSSQPPAPQHHMQAGPNYSSPCPPTHMVPAVLATLFCCLPLGIVAIIKASNVSSSYAQYGYEAAIQASAEASQWVNYSFIAGLVGGGLYFLMMVAAGL